MKNLLFLWLLALLTLPAWVQAQKITVTGRVLDGQGAALPGSTVLERGTTNGTSSGTDGEFSLAVQFGATLTIQAIGFTA